MHFERTHDAVRANHARDGERDVLDAVLAFEDRGAREDRVLIVEHGLDEAARGHRDARVCEALLVDDVVRDLHELVFDGLVAELFRVMEILVEVIDREAGARCRRPSDERAVAVLAEDEAVDVLRVHLVLVREDAAETVRLEHRARADDEVARIIELRREDVRRDVERVRDGDDDGLFRALDDLAHDGRHDFRVHAGELQAVRRLARADGRASRDDDDVRVFAVIVVAKVELDVRAVDAARRMARVDGFAPRLVLVEVDERDFRCELEVRDLVRDG